MARHAPDLTDGVRVLSSTEVAPMPAFVAAASAPPDMIGRLRGAFLAARGQSWFAPLAEPLLLEGFAEVSEEWYAA